MGRRLLSCLGALLLLGTPTRAADFSYAQIQGAASTGNRPYGAVTVISPFGDRPDAAIPMFLLVEPGDYVSPWIRARDVAGILPKVAELVLFRGESIKVGSDADGNPALFVGSTGTSNGADLKIVSVLPGDVDRFRAEEKTHGTGRDVTAEIIVRYWQTLLMDYITLFIRYPLTHEKDILKLLNLIGTQAGLIFKRILIEVAVLLKYDNIPESEVDAATLRSKFGEVIRSMSREQWGQLTGLAFRIPEEYLEARKPAGEMKAPPRRRSTGSRHHKMRTAPLDPP